MAHTKDVVPMILSTSDNPYNPFGDFDRWYAYDEEKGYHTSAYVGRLAYTSSVLSDDENQIMINNAVQKIYDVNPKGLYIIYYEDGRVVRANNELERSIIRDMMGRVDEKNSDN